LYIGTSPLTTHYISCRRIRVIQTFSMFPLLSELSSHLPDLPSRPSLISIASLYGRSTIACCSSTYLYPGQWLMTTCFVSAVGTDILIALTLSYLLLRSKINTSGFTSDLFKRYVSNHLTERTSYPKHLL
jgi:hypothetical protein